MSNGKTSDKGTQKELTPLEPVDVAFFGADGSDRGSLSFTPGPARNYPNIALLKEAVRRQQGRLRRGTAATRNRAKIRGAQSKPWRQKGTGRARAGTRKSPLWRGGGTIFGPTPRKYDYGLPKKQQQVARRHALLSKLLDGETRIIESLSLDKPNTKDLHSTLRKVGAEGHCLIVVGGDLPSDGVRNLVLSCRNQPRVKVVPLAEADTLSLLKAGTVLMTQSAFDELQKKEQELS